MHTYNDSIGVENTTQAFHLYEWNAQISAALFLPMQFCEVTVRNAISESIAHIYGNKWPWNSAFLRSLPNLGIYDPKKDIENAREYYCKAKKKKVPRSQVSKVIPEISFKFWIQMLTSRHDALIWNQQMTSAFPNAPQNLSVKEQRKSLNSRLDLIRLTRNRVAHNEPIFKNNINELYFTIRDIISWRCAETAEWVDEIQDVTRLYRDRPIFLR